jgi:hypothetical protein
LQERRSRWAAPVPGNLGTGVAVTVKARNVDNLVTWELRDYRRDLEAAIARLPETSAQRQVWDRAVLTRQTDHRAADSRLGRAGSVRVCSCGATFVGVAALDVHLDECGDGDAHVEMAFDVNMLVRLGIRRIRMERGLSMDQMAELLGVHGSAVCRIESGKRNAVGWGRTPRTVATLLGIDVPELLRVCEHCQYRPPVGWRCMRCGMSSPSWGNGYATEQ